MLHKAQTAIEKQRSEKEDKDDIVQEDIEQIAIDEDSNAEWEDVEHEADEEPIPSDP
jgi:hypothetical protein